MPGLHIVVDSTADVPPDLRSINRISVVPVLLHRGNQTLRDDIDISRDAFYAWLMSGDRHPQTAAPTVAMFEEVFGELAADGSPILSISVAATLSATYTAACQAAQRLPGAQIVCIDSGSIAMPLSYLALAAADAARAGATLTEVVALVEQLRQQLTAYVALDTLRYLERGGRISRIQALVGGMLDLKPILEVRDGTIRAVERLRSRRRVAERLIEHARARGRYAELSVMYTTDRAAAAELADQCAAAGLMVRERIRSVQIGAVLGAHMGPGALAVTGMLA
ncbi:MAG TPA: DegV family protein [Roseiflexaceae bacterium]|nr:DegV family protein [Roseiflexaceae bacterium]